MADPNLYLKGGVIPERDNEHYIIRLRTPAGMLGVDALELPRSQRNTEFRTLT